LKQGVISPHLVPDASWVDPDLTCTVPTAITASTGLDALTHCIEAFANLHAHPMVDVYALEGIRLITGNLLAAVADGANRPARSRLALGSLYGGLCLGPVNTAAVHALAYPLGSRFHVAHGVSNAVLLPHVLRFNLPAAPERYASIARALGVEVSGSAIAAGEQGILRIEQLIAACPIPRRLSELGIPWTALPGLADAAMTVTRLLKNNPRPLTAPETLEVYHAAW
jgi:alcohol dehydrogenase class IV